MHRSRRVLAAVLALVALLLPAVAVTADGARAPAGAQVPSDADEHTVAPASTPEPDLRRAVPIALAHRAAAVGIPLPVAEEGEPPEPYRTGPREGSPVIIPPPPLRSGTGALYAVGDSVLLGTEPYLRTTLAGWDLRLDGRVSRGIPEGFELVRMNRDRIGDVLVVVLGHNYGGGGHVAGWLEGLLERTDHIQRVVLVTVTEWSPAQREVNRAIRRAPERHDNVVVADWAAVVDANPQFLRDHVHTSRSGAMALANLIAVVTGPAPHRDGVAPPRPRLLRVVDEPVVRTPATAPSPAPTTPTPTTRPGGGGATSSTTAPPATSPSTTATTVVPPTTATTGSSVPPTVPPTSTVESPEAP